MSEDLFHRLSKSGTVRRYDSLTERAETMEVHFTPTTEGHSTAANRVIADINWFRFLTRAIAVPI